MIRDDVTTLRAAYSLYLGELSDTTQTGIARRMEVAGFIGELDAILMKNPKEKDEHE